MRHFIATMCLATTLIVALANADDPTAPGAQPVDIDDLTVIPIDGEKPMLPPPTVWQQEEARIRSMDDGSVNLSRGPNLVQGPVTPDPPRNWPITIAKGLLCVAVALAILALASRFFQRTKWMEARLIWAAVLSALAIIPILWFA